MEIFTPNGLKVRLHADRVRRVLAPVREMLDYEDALRDIELWAKLPAALSSVAAIVTSAATQSWLLTLIASCFAFLLADLFQQFFYSRILKALLPQFMGSWLISFPASLLIGYFLYRNGAIAAAIVQFVIVATNVFGVSDLFLLVFMPVRVFVRKLTGKTVRHIGAMELAFIKILNGKARSLGVTLDWTLYDRRET